jgi:hypothetical protein
MQHVNLLGVSKIYSEVSIEVEVFKVGKQNINFFVDGLKERLLKLIDKFVFDA